jgi:hypothetical protein
MDKGPQSRRRLRTALHAQVKNANLLDEQRHSVLSFTNQEGGNFNVALGGKLGVHLTVAGSGRGS